MKTFKPLKVLLALPLALLIGTGGAAEESASVLEQLRKTYPATRFDAVRPSLLPGLYEVQMGKNIAYVEETGRYFLFGHLYDLPENRDLTAERKSELAGQAQSAPRADLALLPEADGFTVRRSAPTRRVTVFSDPGCGYCRALEKTLAAMPEVEVRIFPLAWQPGSAVAAAAVWCADDRAAAWQALMTRGEIPSVGDCAAGAEVLRRNAALAERLGISGTPTLIAEDGRMQHGALDQATLAAWLSAPEASGSATAAQETETP